MGTAFTFHLLVHFTNVVAIFIDHPHAVLYQNVRSFMTKGDDAVIEWSVNWVAQPGFLIGYYLTLDNG